MIILISDATLLAMGELNLGRPLRCRQTLPFHLLR